MLIENNVIDIMDIKIDADCVDENGLPDIQKVNPMTYNPADSSYHEIGKVLEKAFSIGKNV